MEYLILPILCLIYFEILGQTVMILTNNKPLVFNSFIGFFATLAVYYILSFFPVYFHLNFKIVFLLFVAVVVISVVLIFKKRKLLHITFSYKQLLVLVCFVIALGIFSTYDYIGDITEYDTLSYTNLIGNNIYQSKLNIVDIENGLPKTVNGYAFQAYYLLASNLLYITSAIFQILGLRFFFFTQYIWLYTIIFYFLFSSFFINIINDKKDTPKRTILIFGLLYFCFFGVWYWHLYQPYIGNSFRFLMCSYVLFYLNKYSKNQKDNDLLLILIILLGGVACSNSNSVLMTLCLFAILCVFKHNRKTLVTIIAFSILPITNIVLQIKSNYAIYVLVLMVVVLLASIKFGDKIVELINNRKIINIIIVILFIVLTIVSYFTTKTLFDLNTFINNIVILDDMRWSLTNFSYHWSIVANIMLIALIVIAIKTNVKEKWAKMLLLIMLLFFTPFTVGLFNKLDPVWFRSFEIIFNAYLIFIGIDIVNNYISNRRIQIVFTAVISCIILYFSCFYFFDSTYIRKSKKPDNYNFWLKMTDDEADTLEFAKYYIVTNDLKTSLISSALYQLRSEVPTIKTLFNRKRMNNSTNSAEGKLLRMLYPDEEYFGACYNTDDYDYSKLPDLIKEANLKLMILGKNKIYHDKSDDTYYPLYLLINKTKTPIYENNSFVIYDYR